MGDCDTSVDCLMKLLHSVRDSNRRSSDFSYSLDLIGLTQHWSHWSCDTASGWEADYENWEHYSLYGLPAINNYV